MAISDHLQKTTIDRLRQAVLKGKKLLVVGGLERNFGGSFWNDPRIEHRLGDDFVKGKTVVPRGAGAVILTKFISHSAYHNLVRQCQKRRVFLIKTVNGTGEIRQMLKTVFDQVDALKGTLPMAPPLTASLGERMATQPVAIVQPNVIFRKAIAQKEVTVTRDGQTHIRPGWGVMRDWLLENATPWKDQYEARRQNVRLVALAKAQGKSYDRRQIANGLSRLRRNGYFKPVPTTPVVIGTATTISEAAYQQPVIDMASRAATKVFGIDNLGSKPTSDEDAIKLLDDAIAGLQLAREAIAGWMSKQRERAELTRKLRELLGD